MGQINKCRVQDITFNVLKGLEKSPRAAQIYTRYRGQVVPSQIEITDVRSLCFNMEYLDLQIKALYLEKSESIKSINNFSQQIKANIGNIKQTTSEQELKKIKILLSDFLKKLTVNSECQSEINEHIIESINLTVISSNYIINKMLQILKENVKQGPIEEFMKDDLRTHLKKYLDVAELKSLKDSYFEKYLISFRNFLNEKIKYNCCLEKKELDNIKNKIKDFDENKLKLLKKKSLLDFTKVNELQLHLEYIVKQISLLYDEDNFEKYLHDFLSSYTLVLPLNNILITNIKKLKTLIMALNSNDIKKLDLKNLIEDFNNIAFASYDLLFTKPAKSLAEKIQLLGFLTQLSRTLDEHFTDKVYLIKNEPLRNEFLKFIKNMAQSVELTKEHLLYVTNILQNSKGEKDCSYRGCQELKQTILNTYFLITLEFPKKNFNKLKSKIAKLIDLDLKDENDKKSSYLHTIIYLDIVLKVLQSKQSREACLFTDLGKIRSRLTTAKIALLTATHLKLENQNLDPIKNQKENLITSNPDTTRKNPIGKIKTILLEQIRGTINCLNSDFEILEKIRSVKYQGELFSTYFSTYRNNTSRIQGMMQEITRLLNSNHPNIKPIQAKLQSIHLKLDFLKHLMELRKKASDQEKTGDIHRSFLDLNNGLVKIENEFIQKLVKIKQLFKNTSIFDKFLRLEKIIFNPVNSTNISDVVDIELLRVRLQNIKKILDELSPCIMQIKNEKDKEKANSLLEKFKTLVTSSQINDLLNDFFITIKEANSLKVQNPQNSPPPLPPKKNRKQDHQRIPPLPHQKIKVNENKEANSPKVQNPQNSPPPLPPKTDKKNSFFKPINQNKSQIKPLNNITNNRPRFAS